MRTWEKKKKKKREMKREPEHGNSVPRGPIQLPQLRHSYSQREREEMKNQKTLGFWVK